MAKPFKIFISSPGDVNDERRRASLVITRLAREFKRFYDIKPVLWEYEPMLSSGHFQDIIDPPSDVDILILILWSRLGTPLPARTDVREYKGIDDRVPVTGTEWEYEQALAARKIRGDVPALLVYRNFSKAKAEFDRVEDLEQMKLQWEALQRFWQRHFQNADGSFKFAFNRFESLDQFEATLEEHLRELLRRDLPKLPARQAGDRVDWWQGSPYRGLQAFDIEQAGVFFGRAGAERAVSEALVHRAAEKSAFMLLLGASGVGKSSLVRAGILPDLMAPGFVSGMTTWRYAVVQPSELTPDPFAGLAAVLLGKTVLPELEAIGYREDEIAAQLRGGAAMVLPSIRVALEHAGGAGARPGIAKGCLILVLDQFEVVLTSASFTAETRAALDLLFSELAKSGVVWIVATLRSDFYHRMVDMPELNALATGPGQYLLAPPSAPEIELIIKRPADVAGLRFEVDEKTEISLDSVIRDAAARDPASLPLLSFVLDELYRLDVETNGGSALTYESYAKLGALEGAIARHADAMVKSLTPLEVAALPTLLLALVEIDEIKGTVTARTVRHANLTGALQGELAKRLETERLAVADDRGEGKILRLAHEALLTNWPLLASLIEEHRDFLIIRRRLQADATAWVSKDRHADFLLPSGRRLAEAEEVLSQRRAELDPEIVEFAESSITAERERVAEEQRAREAALRRDLRRATIFGVVSTCLALIAVAGGYYAWQEQRKAESAYQLALHQAVDNLESLAGEFDAGNISGNVLQQQVQLSQPVVTELANAGNTTDLNIARVKLADVLSLNEVTRGDIKALQAVQQENTLADDLKSKNPNNLDILRLWAIARGRWSDILYWQCDCVSAAQRANEGAAAASTVLAARPNDLFLQRRVLTDDETIGDSLRYMGDLDGADKAYASMLQGAQQHLVASPNAPVWLIYLAFALERVGDEFLQRGALPDALKNYQQDLSVAVALYAQNPRSANYLSAVVQAHQRLGDYWMAKGDLPNAITEYKTYVDEVTTLKNEDLSNFRFVEIAYVAHQRLGDAYLQQKNYSGAAGEFNSYRTDVEAYLNSTTANTASNNNAALYDQANAYQKTGDVALASGDLNGALTAYRRSQAVAFQLRDKNCNNGAWQKLVSMSYQRIGNVLKAQNNTALALSQFKSCAAIKVSPTVWSPQALTPRDIDQDCNQEVAQLVGAH